MAKQANPFAEFDVSKMMTAFRMPSVDMDTVVDTHRKNVDAMTKANQVAIDGMQTLVQRQMEIVRHNMDDIVAMTQGFMAADNNDRVTKQADVAKESFERMLGQMKELNDIMSKSQAEAAGVVNARISSMMEEMKATASTINNEMTKKAN